MAYYRRIMYIMYSLVLWRGEKWVFMIVGIVMVIVIIFIRISFVTVVKILLCLVGRVVRGARKCICGGRGVMH